MKNDVSGDENWVRRGTEAHVWAQLEVTDTTSDVLIVGVVQMAVEDLFRQSEGTLQSCVEKEHTSEISEKRVNE